MNNFLTAVSAGAALLVAAPAHAQLGLLRDLHFTGGGLVYAVQQGTDQEAKSRSGTWFGGELEARLGRVSLHGRFLAGPLNESAPGFAQRARSTSVAILYHPAPWVEAGVEGEVLRLASDLSTTLWRFYGVRLGVTTGLGITGLTGRAEAAVYPVTGVVAARALRRPMRAEVGMAYAIPSLPLELRLAYRAENIDFQDTADLRLAGLLAGVAIRLAP